MTTDQRTNQDAALGNVAFLAGELAELNCLYDRDVTYKAGRDAAEQEYRAACRMLVRVMAESING